MSKNIVVLVGSARKSGNTEILADAFIAGAKAAGHTVTKFTAPQSKVAPCLDCKYCFKHPGECVQKDGMQDILPALYAADIVVFASPLYYYGLSAQLRAIIDRFYVSLHKDFPVTQTALLLTYADADESAPNAAILHYRTFTGYLGWEDKGVVCADSVSDKGDITGHAALYKAEALGKIF